MNNFCPVSHAAHCPCRSEYIFNPCAEFRLNPEGPVNQIHFPHLLVGGSGIFSDLLRSVKMLKRECRTDINGKLPHLFIPRKTETLVPEFAVEDLPVGRTAALVPEFAVKDLSLGRTTALIPEFAVKDLTLCRTH